jgi:hypothetical protein
MTESELLVMAMKGAICKILLNYNTIFKFDLSLYQTFFNPVVISLDLISFMFTEEYIDFSTQIIINHPDKYVSLHIPRGIAPFTIVLPIKQEINKITGVSTDSKYIAELIIGSIDNVMYDNVTIKHFLEEFYDLNGGIKKFIFAD